MLNENSKFTITIGKLIVIIASVIGVSFTIGMSYQGLLPDRQLQKEQAAEIQEIKIEVAKISENIKAIKEGHQATQLDVSVLYDTVSKINTELQVINSYIKDEKRNR